MNYSQRYTELNTRFQLGVNTYLAESGTDIRFCSFESQPLSTQKENVLANIYNESINENFSFIYPVFVPHKIKNPNKAILLMHGLNERNWSKYLTWAEFLCEKTGKAVILFPIAFHMNRSPLNWSNPRALAPILELRRKLNGDDRTLSFANVALSERISERPIRFYSSGRQSMCDLTQLFREIKQGLHPMFAPDTQIDIFAYSIGAFLSQITLMTNPQDLFTDSKLFMFCGGSIFSSMSGESRSIMDRPAFAKLLNYYTSDFETNAREKTVHDKGFESFFSMISPERNQIERESFFKRMGNKISGISLAKDHVIPYNGVMKAIGNECAEKCVQLLDFCFPYTHENPFPTGSKRDDVAINASFDRVFSSAAHFLA
ncbi:MAG: DUF6051 family protein [Paludibacter sp.]